MRDLPPLSLTSKRSPPPHFHPIHYHRSTHAAHLLVQEQHTQPGEARSRAVPDPTQVHPQLMSRDRRTLVTATARWGPATPSHTDCL